MKKKSLRDLSRRERQIMDIIYQKKEASAAEVRQLLPGDLTDSGVRTLLRVLVNKGILNRKEKGLKYVYFPSISMERAQNSALKHLKKTFFNNSAESVLTALVKSSDFKNDDFEKFIDIINKAKGESHE